MKPFSARAFPSRFQVRRVAVGVLFGGLAWLLYTAARSQILLSNGRAIAAQSANFPADYFVGSQAAPGLTYLAMGDSTAAGWGAGTLQATYPYLIAQNLARSGWRVHVVNVAVGGATLREVREHQLPALKTVRPQIVTLSVGANDATHFTAPDDFATELQSVRTALETSPARAILVANTPDMWLAPALPLPLSAAVARRARHQNAILARTLEGSPLHVVDLYRYGKLDARKNPELYASDRFHPSAQGYAQWARLFLENLPVF